MNDIPMTVVGNVVNDVELRFTSAGDPVASFRIASTVRRFDRANERWVDGDTHWFSVSCWRQLAENVASSLQKGMPVLVTGRLRSRQVERPCGDHAHLVRFHDIEAVAVGPDLARGTAAFTRTKSGAVVESERRSTADAMAYAAEHGLLERIDLETGEITDDSGAVQAAVDPVEEATEVAA